MLISFKKAFHQSKPYFPKLDYILFSVWSHINKLICDCWYCIYGGNYNIVLYTYKNIDYDIYNTHYIYHNQWCIQLMLYIPYKVLDQIK